MKKRTIWITSAAAAGVLAIGATATAFAVGSDGADDRDDRTAVPVAPLGGGAGTAGGGSSDQLDAAMAAALAEAGAGTVTDADVDDDASHAYEIDIRLDAGGSVEVKLDRDLNVVSVSRDDDDDEDDGFDDGRAIDPADRQRAIDAALAHAGGGTVSEVELSDDDDRVWEVEVQLPNGGDLDVELDAAFAVVEAD
jgi:uncharacterized membrane protein YkoI